MMTETTADTGAADLGRGGRMSRQRKRGAVLRLLRGEDLELVSRSLGVTAATLSGWRDAFLAAGEASLATRPTDGQALQSERLKARLGEMLLERELLEAKVTALEARAPGGAPWPGPRVPGLAHLAGHGVSASLATSDRPAAAAGPTRADAGCGVGRGNPGRPLCASPFHGEGHRKVWAKLA
jgi:transposase-like protein